MIQNEEYLSKFLFHLYEKPPIALTNDKYIIQRSTDSPAPREGHQI